MPMQSIVVGVDGSPESVQAAVLGEGIARRAGAVCRLVHAAPDYWSSVVTPDGAVDPALIAAATEAQARRLMSHSLEGQVSHDLVAGLEVRIGRSSVILADRARDLKADLLILGGKRRRALARLAGSTVTHVVRLGAVPVLATDGVVTDIRRILVAVDLSYAARPTLDVAENWARILGAELRILHTVEPLPPVPGLQALADDQVFRLAEHAIQAEVGSHVTYPGAQIVVRRGRSAAAITAEAQQWRADLIIVGSHGKGWVDRLLIGSTSERLLNVLPAAVMVVPVALPVQATEPDVVERHQRPAVLATA